MVSRENKNRHQTECHQVGLNGRGAKEEYEKSSKENRTEIQDVIEIIPFRNQPILVHQFGLTKCQTPCEQENNLQEYFGRVPGGTRTHDIQNHKQSCECLINPVFIGVSAIFDFLFAAILRLFTQEPILFQ